MAHGFADCLFLSDDTSAIVQLLRDHPPVP